MTAYIAAVATAAVGPCSFCRPATSSTDTERPAPATKMRHGMEHIRHHRENSLSIDCLWIAPPGDATWNDALLLWLARALGGTVFFHGRHSAMPAAGGVELCGSSGSAAGTMQFVDIYPVADGSYPSSLMAANGRRYLAATDPTGGDEL